MLSTTMNRLENKVILITGSVTGIGKAIAKRCVAEGARVLIHGLEADLGQETLAEIGADKASLATQRPRGGRCAAMARREGC